MQYNTMLGEELFEKLYLEYNKSVYNYIHMSIKNYHLAEDLTAEVFLKVYKHRNKINDVDKSGKWLITIARNTIIDYYRKGKIEEPFEFIEFESFYDYGYDDVLIRDELRSLNGILKELSEDDKKIIELRFNCGLKFKEIAAFMNMTESTVKCRLSRAMKKIREQSLIRYKYAS